MLIILFSARQTCSFSACSTREKPFYATNNNKKKCKVDCIIVLLIGDPFFFNFNFLETQFPGILQLELQSLMSSSYFYFWTPFSIFWSNLYRCCFWDWSRSNSLTLYDLLFIIFLQILHSSFSLKKKCLPKITSLKVDKDSIVTEECDEKSIVYLVDLERSA